MAKRKRRLDFEIDKLTSSIENTFTGEVFQTDVIRLHRSDQKLIKKKDWQFDWSIELADPESEVYALVTRENLDVFHGLISLYDPGDHIWMNLIESAKINFGADKLYAGVAGNLVAFACKLSFQKGYNGIVAFEAKTKLIEHYEMTLGAKRFKSNRMFINREAAYKLATLYFKDFDNAN
jgi:hypothetical protein